MDWTIQVVHRPVAQWPLGDAPRPPVTLNGKKWWLAEDGWRMNGSSHGLTPSIMISDPGISLSDQYSASILDQCSCQGYKMYKNINCWCSGCLFRAELGLRWCNNQLHKPQYGCNHQCKWISKASCLLGGKSKCWFLTVNPRCNNWTPRCLRK